MLWLFSRMLPTYNNKYYSFENQRYADEKFSLIKDAYATIHIIEGCAGNSEGMGSNCKY